jgi:hypothetical protein
VNEPWLDALDWDAAQHPSLGSISSGMLGLRVVPVLKATLPVEFVNAAQLRRATDDLPDL